MSKIKNITFYTSLIMNGLTLLVLSSNKIKEYNENKKKNAMITFFKMYKL